MSRFAQCICVLALVAACGAASLCAASAYAGQLGVGAASGDVRHASGDAGSREFHHASAQAPVDDFHSSSADDGLPESSATSRPADAEDVLDTLSSRQGATPSPETRTYWDMGVPAIMQYPELPTGCESVALTEALNYYGFDLEKTVIADEFLPRSDSDYVFAFLGDPHTYDGLTVMAPGITAAANKFLESRGSSLHAYGITGVEFDDLYRYLDRNVPVVVWTTIDLTYSYDYATPQDSYEALWSAHCVTLSGYDRENNAVIVADPLEGTVLRDKDRFAESYELMGSQAVIIE